MFEFLDSDVLTTLLEIVLINLALSGDNVIVIGLAAAGLPQAQQGKAILIGAPPIHRLRVTLRVREPPSENAMTGAVRSSGS